MKGAQKNATFPSRLFQRVQGGGRAGGSRLFLSAALLLIILGGLNLHLVVWQIYGWGGMLMENRAASGSWSEAVQTTFAGEKPCGVCRSVEQALESGEGAINASFARGDFSFGALFFISMTARQAVPSRSALPGVPFPGVFNLPVSWSEVPSAPPPRVFPA